MSKLPNLKGMVILSYVILGLFKNTEHLFEYMINL